MTPKRGHFFAGAGEDLQLAWIMQTAKLIPARGKRET